MFDWRIWRLFGGVPRLRARSLAFPAPESARDDGLLAIGGDLSADRLLEAYRHGIFPWYEADGPILWWCPDPRMVLDPNAVVVSRSLRATLRKQRFTVRFDTAFAAVVRACADTPRSDELGTWITPEVEAGYGSLHQRGHAHSIESWRDGQLVGGLYGVLLGRCFFGESMFTRQSDASKVALVALAEKLRSLGVSLIDCQIPTAHLASLGAQTISRRDFLDQLALGLQNPILPGLWQGPESTGDRVDPQDITN